MGSMIMWMAGLVFGFLHAFDPDHLAAVSTFVTGNPKKKASVRFALEWGIGHSLSLLGLTVVVLALGKSMGPFAERVLETAVGFTLVGLGIWRLADFLGQRFGIHSHSHGNGQDKQHEHFHVHRDAHHDHGHVAGFVGLLHGAAGSARFLVLIPIALISSWTGSLMYVVFFSCGVVIAMMSYAVALGHLLGRGGKYFPPFPWVYQPLSAMVSITLGIYWIAQTL